MIPAGEGGLLQDSVALCYQMAVLDQQRLLRQLGALSPRYLQLLKQALQYTLQLDDLGDEDEP